ncbi:MARCKS-related protein 1-A-like [Oncorhynchus clarkii lewisi]|uniref:MARCKS-related protein 1-A-like n=1 Tax=Oncorhynchus clarkii lewisi TaxID=490388 RepID=UPI0039B85CB9
MGAQLSKGGVAVEGKAVADPAVAKTNGQENGHVKTNGDVSAKPDGDAAAVDGNGIAEPAKQGEMGAGDAIEAAPAAEGDAVKAEGEAAKDAKKKKKFSLKNSFKFKGISLRKTKKNIEEGKEAASPTAEDKPEENGHAAKETKEETPATEPVADAKEEATLAPESEAAAAEEAPPAEEAPAEEAATPAEVTTPAASEAEPKAE